MAGRRRSYGEVREYAAHRRAGHEWWKWYVVWKPLLRRAGPPAATAAALFVAWVKIPHLYLGLATLGLGVAVAGGWLAYQESGAALQRRMNNRALTAAPRGAGLGWAVGGVVAILGAASWLALGSPWA